MRTTLLTAPTPANNLDDTIVALLGYGVVILALLILVFAVIAIVKFFVRKAKTPAREKKTAPVDATPVSEESVAEPETAPGTAGQLKLYDVPPKTAAMLMAIVAEKTGKPLNELRFISIKEVK